MGERRFADAYEIKPPAQRHDMAVDVAELGVGRAALGYF